MAKASVGEQTFALHLKAEKLDGFEQEYRFDLTRRWRFDFAHVPRRVAVEIEGGTWSGGRHTRGSGYAKDLEKYNAAARQGWLVLRYTTNQVKSGEAIAEVSKVMRGE